MADNKQDITPAPTPPPPAASGKKGARLAVRLLCWLSAVVLSVVALCCLAVALIYVPPVQNWLVKKAAAYASETMAMNVSVEHVCLVFPLHLGVDGVLVTQPNDTVAGQTDTIASVERIVVDVQLRPLFDGRVEVDALELHGVNVNTADLVAAARVKGHIGLLALQCHGIDLGQEMVTVDSVQLSDADLFVAINDSVPADTTESEKSRWKIAVGQVAVANTAVALQLGDELLVAASMDTTIVANAYIDLYKDLYTVQQLAWHGGTVAYDNLTAEATPGLDPNHIALSNVRLGVDSVAYSPNGLMAHLSECAFGEKSGLEVTALTAHVAMDTLRLLLPDLRLLTPHSRLAADLSLDLNAFSNDNPGSLRLTANGSIGKHDLWPLLADLPPAVLQRYPNHPLELDIALAGNLQHMDINALTLNLPTVVRLSANGNYNLAGGNGQLAATIDSRYSSANASLALHATMRHHKLEAALNADIRSLDLYALQLTDSPLTISLNTDLTLTTDLNDLYHADGTLANITILDTLGTHCPDDLSFSLLAESDTTAVTATCGDFLLAFMGDGGYKALADKGSAFASLLTAQLAAKRIDINALRATLPTAELHLSVGTDNPAATFLNGLGYTFQQLQAHFTTTPADGMNGQLDLYTLCADDLQIDTVRFTLVSDSTQCTYHGQVCNANDNPQYAFNALFNGQLFANSSALDLQLYDDRNQLGVQLSLEASVDDDGVRLHLLPDSAVVGYQAIDIDNDNYIFLSADEHIDADLAVSLHQLDLTQLAMLPYMPDISGTMDGDFHVVVDHNAITVSSSVGISGLVYEGSAMGDIGTELVYVPQPDGSHGIDAQLAWNGYDVAVLRGSYRPANEQQSELIDATLAMERFPLRLANGFVPDGMVALEGYADGHFGISGTSAQPVIGGQIALDSCFVHSAQYGVTLHIEGDDTIRIDNNRLSLTDFKIYSKNDNPMHLDGSVDFADLESVKLNLRLAAKNFLLIDSKETRKSVAFGKAYVDVFARVSGTTDRMRMQGRLDVLAATDMSYILEDSPLTTDNQLDELVRFVNFQDTVAAVVEHKPVSGFAADLTLNVTNGARIMCYLNTAKTNYIDLAGGGSLVMKCENDDLRLTGKYSLDGGEMKYSLPIIPLKTFTIQDGSYIEFTGDAMNPKLNITATESTSAPVATSGSAERTVDFECGVIITRTLNDIGLEFTLDAPEDLSLHNELLEMGAEQRGKLAVTMLTTGMYLADGNTSGFSMNSALSSFLQNEINNITGNALRTLDLSIGLDNTTDASGNSHTDYSFKFAKRFWNNRLKIVIGGKVTTGSEAADRNDSFFDNVTFEYRLGSSADKYLKLFYDNNAYDWLEGTTREYGGGFIWRRSLSSLKDILRMKSNTPQPQPNGKQPTASNGQQPMAAPASDGQQLMQALASDEQQPVQAPASDEQPTMAQ